MTLGEKLRQARTEAGLSMCQLEKLSGVPKQLISRYEAGQSVPLARNINALAFALGLSAEDLTACEQRRFGNPEEAMRLELTKDMSRLLFLYCSLNDSERADVINYAEQLHEGGEV